MKYSDLLYDIDDESGDIENTPLEDRLYRLAENTIPDTIDRTEDGEFVIDDTIYGEEGYFLNEDCSITFYAREGEVKAFYYSDADKEYHFDINVHGKMTDKDIKLELVKGFSNKFGWVERYVLGEDPIEGVDTKFWISFYHDAKRKLVEVGREVFQADLDVYDDNDEWIEEEYDKLVTMILKVALENFQEVKENDAMIEFYGLTEDDIMDCAFMSVGLVEFEDGGKLIG